MDTSRTHERLTDWQKSILRSVDEERLQVEASELTEVSVHSVQGKHCVVSSPGPGF